MDWSVMDNHSAELLFFSTSLSLIPGVLLHKTRLERQILHKFNLIISCILSSQPWFVLDFQRLYLQANSFFTSCQLLRVNARYSPRVIIYANLYFPQTRPLLTSTKRNSLELKHPAKVEIYDFWHLTSPEARPRSGALVLWSVRITVLHPTNVNALSYHQC